MCNQKHTQELTQRFLQLPKNYQKNIFELAREKIQLYQVEQIKNEFDLDFRVPSR